MYNTYTIITGQYLFASVDMLMQFNSFPQLPLHGNQYMNVDIHNCDVENNIRIKCWRKSMLSLSQILQVMTYFSKGPPRQLFPA